MGQWPERGKVVAGVAQSSCSPCQISLRGQRGPWPHEEGDFESGDTI